MGFLISDFFFGGGASIASSGSESLCPIDKGCERFHSICVSHYIGEVKVDHANLSSELFSHFQVSCAVEDEVVDGFWWGYAPLIFATCRAVARFHFVDFVKVGI